MMIKSSKKADLKFSKLIKVLLSILGLVVLLTFTTTSYANSKYDALIASCYSLSNSVDGDPTFFTSANEPNELFISTFAKSCPSKEVSVSKTSVKQAANLARDCWLAHGNGANVLAKNSYDQNVCFYCGTIKPSEDINNFNDKFIQTIRNKDYNFLFDNISDSSNLNSITLKEENSLPDSIDENEELIVYYFIHKPNIDFELGDSFFDNSLEFIGEYAALAHSSATQFISGFGYVGTKLGELLSGDYEKPISGVVIEEFRVDNEEFNTREELRISVEGDLKTNCLELITPTNHFD